MKYELEITRDCNFKCAGCDRLCNLVDDKNSNMTLEEVKKIVDEINIRNEHIEHFVIIGGEPTMNPECVEICKYVKENLNRCGYFALATNHSNKEVVKKIIELGYKIRHDDKSEDKKEIIKNKLDKHFNILLSPKEKGYKITNPKKCWILKNCSTSIHKFKGKIKYCWCGVGSSLAKLLQKEEFMKDSLDELFNSDINKYFEEICPHCMYISTKRDLFKETSGQVSDCFKSGLKKLMEIGYDS